MSLDNFEPDVKSIDLTAAIVSSYVSNNSLQAADIPALISSIHGALLSLNQPAAVEPAKAEPRIPIKKTITPDYLISLEDGKHYKSLKRHLAGQGLTPQEYRQKWGLSADYPMVAASYAKRRSDLAKANGLGRKPAPAPVAAPKRAPRRKAA